MKNYNIQSLVDSNKEILSISTQGWVRNKRIGKNISFINLNDGSVLSGIQVIIEQNKNTEEEMKMISIGSSITIKGNLVKSLRCLPLIR